MASFSLTHGANKYDFDVFGTVSQNNNHIGLWSTDNDNNIVLTEDGGGEITFGNLTWQFNSDNHLCLSSGGAQLINFNTVPDNTPIYATRNAVLIVRPDSGNAFSFNLHGEWDLDDQHDLNITINGVKSVLDGYILDPRSRFVYHFFDKQNSLSESILVFTGQWDFVNDDGVPKLNFTYQRADGSTDTFSMPQGIVVNRSRNQFMYQYNKENETYGVQFVGLLSVSPDLQITYSIDRQVSQSGQQQVASTTFTMGAVLNMQSLTGDIEFLIKKEDGTTGTTTIGLKGAFTAMLGETQLQIGFTFTQVRGPNTVTTTFGISGSLKMGNGGQVVLAVAVGSTSTTISVAASDIVLGDARLDGRLNLTAQNGKVVGVQALFGISF